MSEVKDRILTVGIDLFSKKGYHNVGLKEILKKAEVPKGSFYHYFESKEDFGVQVINKYSSLGIVNFQKILVDEALSPKNRIIEFYTNRSEHFLLKECREGCLMGNSSNELGDLSESFSNVIASEFSLWQNTLEKCIVEGQDAGEITSDIEPRMLSSFVLNSWEGALLRMKCEKTVEPLKDFIAGLHILLR